MLGAYRRSEAARGGARDVRRCGQTRSATSRVASRRVVAELGHGLRGRSLHHARDDSRCEVRLRRRSAPRRSRPSAGRRCFWRLGCWCGIAANLLMRSGAGSSPPAAEPPTSNAHRRSAGPDGASRPWRRRPKVIDRSTRAYRTERARRRLSEAGHPRAKRAEVAGKFRRRACQLDGGTRAPYNSLWRRAFYLVGEPGGPGRPPTATRPQARRTATCTPSKAAPAHAPRQFDRSTLDTGSGRAVDARPRVLPARPCAWPAARAGSRGPRGPAASPSDRRTA